MPSRHGQPDPDDETTQQAYYGQHGATPSPGRQQQGQYQPPGGQYGGQQGYGGQQQYQPPGYPPPGQGGSSPSGPQGPPGGGQVPKKRKKWPWIVGAVVLLFLIIGVANGGGDQASPTGGQARPSAAPTSAPTSGEQADAPATSAAPAAGEGIVYEVTGEGRASNITYSSNGSGGISQQNNARLPFTKTVSTGDEFFGFWSLTAQNGEDSGTISCKITKDGEVINENTSEGPYAVVSCTGS